MNFEDLKVLVIGDVMLDHYSYGVTNRRSPEADVPIFDLLEDDYKLGGAANVAVNIKALGAQVKIISVIGDDESGKHLESLMTKANLEKIIFKDDDRKTTVKQRLIVDNKHILRIDDESHHDISAEIETRIKNECQQIFETSLPDVIVLQDYNKGLLTKNLIHWIIEQANALGIKTAVDPKKENFSSYSKASLIKPNRNEMSWAIGHQLKLDNIEKAVSDLQQKMDIEYWFVTLSEDGVYAADYKNKLHLKADSIEVIDVCGAGDNLISVLALMICKDHALSGMAEICNTVGKMSCLTAGTAVIDAVALNKAIM